MKRLVTAVVLLAVLGGVCIGCRWDLARLADALSAEVETFTMLTWEGNITQAQETLLAAREGWRSNRTLLGAVLPHTELDEIERLFEAALQAAENGDLSECRMQAAELRALLRHLPEREEPSLANIF